MSEKLCTLKKVGGGNTSANAYYVSGKTSATLNGTVSIPTPSTATKISIIIFASDMNCYIWYDNDITTTQLRFVNNSQNQSRTIGASNCPVKAINDNEIQLLSWANTIQNRDFKLLFTTEN